MQLWTSCCFMIYVPFSFLLLLSNLWPSTFLIPWNDQLLHWGQYSSRRLNPPSQFRHSLLPKVTQRSSRALHGVLPARGFLSLTSRMRLIGHADLVLLTAHLCSLVPPAMSQTHFSVMPPMHSTVITSRMETPISHATLVELQSSPTEIQVKLLNLKFSKFSIPTNSPSNRLLHLIVMTGYGSCKYLSSG